MCVSNICLDYRGATGGAQSQQHVQGYLHKKGSKIKTIQVVHGILKHHGEVQSCKYSLDDISVSHLLRNTSSPDKATTASRTDRGEVRHRSRRTSRRSSA